VKGNPSLSACSTRLSDGVGTRRTITTPRLYRGLKGPYDPTRAIVQGASGVDFTDCPFTALSYATGRRGVLLVVDVNDGTARVSEEFWLNRGARRFMIWTSFADLVIAEMPAKELRAQIRRRGIVTASHEDKAMILGTYIERRIKDVGTDRW
jgi:hypothetical protein